MILALTTLAAPTRDPVPFLSGAEPFHLDESNTAADTPAHAAGSRKISSARA
jgi:hypothetical protein